MEYIKRIRNIGIAAHIDAGKTTTTERILYYTGKIYRMGEVDEGTATMDWMIQEKERGITITAAATTCFWRDHQINIIDTPGHVDFTIEVERCLKVLDGAVIVFCGVGGVESQTETVWHQADKYRVPRIAFVNKLDRIGSDFERVIKMMEERLSLKPLPIQIPYGEEENFQGVIDLVEEVLYIWYEETLGAKYDKLSIPEEYREKVKLAKEKMIEILSEEDEEILEKYLKGEEISIDLIKRAIRKGTLKLKFYPVLCGSALKNKGIQPLLDAIIDYLPSPIDLPPAVGFHPKNNNIEERKADISQPFSALIFKIQNDFNRGLLSYFRVYSGKIRIGKQILVVPTMEKIRVNKILLMHANKQEEIEELKAGEIGAIVGLKNVKTGYTLCDLHAPIAFEPLTFPEPVIFATIEPKTKKDEKKLQESLELLSIEDPTFKVKYDEETGQRIIMGMGELHLEIITDRLQRDYGVPCYVGKPQVSYRETIRKESTGIGKFSRIIDNKLHQAEIKIKISPKEKGINIIFNVDEEKIPEIFYSKIEETLMGVANSGLLIGYPITNILIEIFDGAYNKENPSDFAFQIAANNAFNEAYKNASPTILEPIMSIEILTPEEYVGTIINDLVARRGKILKIEVIKEYRVLSGIVPLKETFGYATAIRSLSSGRATYSMHFSHYDILPEEEIKKIFPYLEIK
ncbi:MAG: elongation factor G [candidate division WOR-3 bacterium]|nr:elongation factor G [candidate division WOR-3 bacterium]MCX7837061.1 elongation factor G [candidate division WOR-3 bacterium]MDW8114233.1 elongation factor G [candidate division WOR-3 bacterium]